MEGVFAPAGCEHRMEWAKQQRPLTALMAVSIAAAADECHELLKICCGEDLCPVDLHPQNVSKWVRLYSRRRVVAAELEGIFKDVVPQIAHLSCAEGIGMLWGDLTEAGGIDLLDDAMWREAFSKMHVRYFFRVAMPCWLLYGEVPATLLRRVGFGHLEEADAVEKLLVLDSLIVHHPRIARYLNCANVSERQERSAMVGEWLGKPLALPSKRKLKYLLAALISRISELLGTRLDEPRIRALFDALAKDRDLGLRDSDLPESPETFAKAIQRNRSFWNLPDVPDEESLKAVRVLEALLT